MHENLILGKTDWAHGTGLADQDQGIEFISPNRIIEVIGQNHMTGIIGLNLVIEIVDQGLMRKNADHMKKCIMQTPNQRRKVGLGPVHDHALDQARIQKLNKELKTYTIKRKVQLTGRDVIKRGQGLQTKQKQIIKFIADITKTAQDHMKGNIQEEITDHKSNLALGMVHKRGDGQILQMNAGVVVGIREREIALHLHQMEDGATISFLNNRERKDFQETEIEKVMVLQEEREKATATEMEGVTEDEVAGVLAAIMKKVTRVMTILTIDVFSVSR